MLISIKLSFKNSERTRKNELNGRDKTLCLILFSVHCSLVDKFKINNMYRLMHPNIAPSPSHSE